LIALVRVFLRGAALRELSVWVLQAPSASELVQC
jgi:hypothetical protein